MEKQKYSKEHKKADKILLEHIQPDKTAKEMFQSIPQPVLLEYISLLKIVRKQGVTGPDVCSECHHLHNNGIYDWKRQMLMLDRAEQTLAGIWK